MSVAQTRAARRRFREYYGKPIIGRPHYKRKSVAAMDRAEANRRAKQAAMAGRKRK
jgi:hypothetical protein